MAIGRCNSACLERACAWTFRVAGVGDRGSACLERACVGAFRAAGVGLRMHVGVWEDAGRWIRLAGVVNRAFLTLLRVRFAWQVWGMVAIGGAARVVSRDRRGDSCTRRAFSVAGGGKGVTFCVAGHRFAWQAQGMVCGS